MRTGLAFLWMLCGGMLLNLHAQSTVFIHTDQDVYATGAQVRFKAYIQPDQASVQETLDVFLLNPDGGIMQQASYQLTNNTLSSSFKLTAAAGAGLYSLVAMIQGTPAGLAFEKPLLIRDLEIPGLLIDLEHPDRYLSSADQQILQVRFLGPDGEPVRKQRYSWQILVNGETVSQADGRADRDGRDEISLTFPRTGENSLVTLNVSASYFEQVYSVQTILPSHDFPLIVEWFPEGGLLIDGFESRMAIRSSWPDGEPAAIRADLVTSSGEQLQSLSTSSSGYGIFTLIPDAANPLFMKITEPAGIDRLFPLPSIRSNGLVFRYLGHDGNGMQFQAMNPVVNTYMMTEVRAFQAGRLIWSQRLLVQTQKTFSIPLSGFSDGLIQVGVFNDRVELMAIRTIISHDGQQEISSYATGSLSVVDAVLSPALFPQPALEDWLTTAPGLPAGLPPSDHEAFLLAHNDLPAETEASDTDLSRMLEETFRKDYTLQYLEQLRVSRLLNAHYLHPETGLPDYYTQNRAILDQMNMLPRKLSPEERMQRMLDQGKPVLSVIRAIRAYRLVNNQMVFRGGTDSFNDPGGAVIVIDGVPKGADIGVIENLSPHDVASIRISTSVSDIMKYSGMEDTAGVVLIETRKGGPSDPHPGDRYGQQLDPLIMWDPAVRSGSEPDIPVRQLKGPVRITRVN